MGRGDRRTKRGKIFKQSYGKHRPAKKNQPAYVPKPSVSEEIIEKAVIGKVVTPAIIKEKKVVTKNVEKKVTAEKKPKVAKLEELTPEILIDLNKIKPEKKVSTIKKAPTEKKVPVVKSAPEKKEISNEKAAKEKAPKATNTKVAASKDKPAVKKVKS